MTAAHSTPTPAKQPQPALSANSIAGTLKAVSLVLGWLGLNDAKHVVDIDTEVIVAIVLGLVALVPDVLAALHIRGQVTPKNSPQADDGTQLVRADSIILPPTVDPAPMSVQVAPMTEDQPAAGAPPSEDDELAPVVGS